MFENTPSHVQQQYADKTLNWCSSDSEERFNTNLERIETLRLLGSNGWIDSDHPRTKLTYKFNSQGFRSREINLDSQGIAVFGCSFTAGIGLPDYELYHYYLGNQIKLPVDNFGVLGASNGLMFRLAQYWLPVLKPHAVVLQTTFKERFEIVNQDNVSNVMSPQWKEITTQSAFRNWWFTDTNSIVDQQRNELAIRHLCHQLDIPIFVIDVEDFRNPVNGLSRDLDHSGPLNHQQVADNLCEQIHAHARFHVLKDIIPQ
jgi:hypothetical protein